MEAKDDEGKTALVYAKHFKHEHAARLLRGDDTM